MPSMLVDPEKLRALDVLRTGRRFLLCGHQRPDGDVLGAQTALARVLQSQQKEVWIVNPDLPEPRYDYLARDCRFRAFAGDLPAHDVVVTLDFSELSRLGEMEAAVRASGARKLVVDHHLHEGDVWWDERFVDTSAAATGLLVRRIASALDIPLDAAAARGIYTCLVTDTGWFKYSNTDAETLRAAAEMVELGVVPSEVHAALVQRRSPSHPRFVASLLSGITYHEAGRVAIYCEAADLPRDGEVDSDEVLDIVRSVEQVEIVLYLREMKAGSVKLSARSKTSFDVNRLARGLGGGGHRRAAGATIVGALGEVRARVLQATAAQLAEAGQEGG
jgi:phosphoesterase RecJ-like protein